MTDEGFIVLFTYSMVVIVAIRGNILHGEMWRSTS